MFDDDTVALTRGELPALALAPRAPITRLRLRGHEHEPIELPAEQATFTIGAKGCDVIVPRRISRAVSWRHARLEREGSALRVVDLGSRNGSFAGAGRAREASFQVPPGGTFQLADVEILATDLGLEATRAHLACAIGIDRDAEVDQAVIDVASGEPLLLVGAHGTGKRRLAAVIHATGPQRDNVRIDGAPVPGLIRFAQGASVYVDLDTLPALPARYVAALFDRRRGLRLIFATTDERHARRCLDHYTARLRTIALTPLAWRLQDVVHLLQFIWSTEWASVEPVAALGPDALAALAAYPWPRNLEELYDQAPRLLAYQQRGGLRPAAAALGIRHQTLAQHLARLGFPIVPQRERETPLHGRARTERRVR